MNKLQAIALKYMMYEIHLTKSVNLCQNSKIITEKPVRPQLEFKEIRQCGSLAEPLFSGIAGQG